MRTELLQVIYITLSRAEYYVDRLVGATFCMTVNLGYSHLFFEDLSVWHLSVIRTSCHHCRMSNKTSNSESSEAASFI